MIYKIYFAIQRKYENLNLSLRLEYLIQNKRSLCIVALILLKRYDNDIKQSGIIFEHLVYVHHVTIATTKTFNVVKLIRLTNTDEILLGKIYKMR